MQILPLLVLLLLLLPGAYSFLTLETLVEKKLGGEVTITTSSASGWPELVKLEDEDKTINLYDVFSGCVLMNTGMTMPVVVNSTLNSHANISTTISNENFIRNNSLHKNETSANFTLNCLTTCQIGNISVNVNGEEIALWMLLLSVLGLLIELIREENGTNELGPVRRALGTIHQWMCVCYEYVIAMMIIVFVWMKNCLCCGRCCCKTGSSGMEAVVVQGPRSAFVDIQRSQEEEDAEVASLTAALNATEQLFVVATPSPSPSASPVSLRTRSRGSTPRSGRSRGSSPGSARKVRFGMRARDAKGRFTKTPPPTMQDIGSDSDADSPVSLESAKTMMPENDEGENIEEIIRSPDSFDENITHLNEETSVIPFVAPKTWMERISDTFQGAANLIDASRRFGEWWDKRA